MRDRNQNDALMIPALDKQVTEPRQHVAAVMSSADDGSWRDNISVEIIEIVNFSFAS